MTKRVYAGMIYKGIEFFKVNGVLHCSHNWRQYTYQDFPPYVIEILEREILNDPVAIKCLSEMDGLLPEEYNAKFGSCRFGGLDDKPDVDEHGNVNYSEYVECPIRGTCKAEGKLCLALQVKNGYLTKREIDVLKLVGEMDKTIADILGISIETVNSHWINIRKKTELQNKSQLAIFASKKGII